MEEIHKKFLASSSTKSGTANALTMAASLEDDVPTPVSKKVEEDKPLAKPPAEQRILLLQAFLALGQLPHAFYLLSRYPWVAQSHPAVADLILRIVNYSVDPLFKAKEEERNPDADEEDWAAVKPAFAARGPKEIIKTLMAPPPITTATKKYEFFYPDWRQDLEIWTSQHDIFEKGLRLLGWPRGLGGRNATLMAKICRIGQAHFMDLKRQKEVALGLDAGAKSRDETERVLVSLTHTIPGFS
jgi:THO complex subunit 2